MLLVEGSRTKKERVSGETRGGKTELVSGSGGNWYFKREGGMEAEEEEGEYQVQ